MKAASSRRARSPRSRATRKSSRSILDARVADAPVTIATTPSAPPLLKAELLNQYYGGSHILRSVSLEARVGEVTVVLGRNGVGKTTLLKSLMGVVPVRSGRVLFDGDDI